MEIEERLRKFQLAAPPARMRRQVLAAARPWRPWRLAAAAALVLCCSAVNTLSEARLHRVLASGGESNREASLPGPKPGRFIVSAPPGIGADSLIALRSALEGANR